MEKREIKFRAWNGEMHSWEEMISKTQSAGSEGISIDYPMYMLKPNYGIIWMQYTGLKDKNGKEIYEGDVVKMHRFIEVLGSNMGVSEGEQEDVGHISIEPLGLAINCDSQEDSGYLLHLHGLHEESFEVIGNIYENPELLNN